MSMSLFLFFHYPRWSHSSLHPENQMMEAKSLFPLLPHPFEQCKYFKAECGALPIQKRISDGLRLTEHYQPLKPTQESQDHQSPGCSSSLLPEALLTAFGTLPALTCYSPASSLLPCLCLNALSLSWPPTSFLFRFQPLSCISWLSDLIYFIFPHHSLTILCSFSRNNL